MVTYKIDNNEPLEVQSWKGVRYSLLPIPPDIDPKDSDKKAERTKWIEDMLEKSIASDSIDDVIHCILTYLLTRHSDAARTELHDCGVLPRKLDEYDIAATMEATNMGVCQWRELVKCFKIYQEVDAISISEEAWRKLGEDHSEIKCGK